MKAIFSRLLVLALLGGSVGAHAMEAALDERNETVRRLLEARGMIRSGRYFEAMEKLQTTIALADQTGEHLIAALALGNMAEIYRLYGNTERAVSHYREALEKYRLLGHRAASEATQKKIDRLAGPVKEVASPPSGKEGRREATIDRAIERVRKRLEARQEKHDDREAALAADYAGYLETVKQAIVAAWTYPEVARRNFKEGRVDVEFTILEHGWLDRVRVVQTSGHASMDLAAVDAVKAAAPFPRIPEHLGIQRLDVEFTFNYALK